MKLYKLQIKRGDVLLYESIHSEFDLLQLATIEIREGKIFLFSDAEFGLCFVESELTFTIKQVEQEPPHKKLNWLEKILSKFRGDMPNGQL